jgi:hypothetical protein
MIGASDRSGMRTGTGLHGAGVVTIEAMIAWRKGLRYRILYGFACRFLEGANRTAYTCERSCEIPADYLLAAVLQIATVDRDDTEMMELAREAVEDASAGRRARW